MMNAFTKPLLGMLLLGSAYGALGASAPAAKVTADTSCSIDGAEWKNVLAQLAHRAAADFGRWEFTSDLAEREGKLVISESGLARCASQGRPGCPLVAEVLAAQDGETAILDGQGAVVANPPLVRSSLIQNFAAQKRMEAQKTTFIDENASPLHRKVQAGDFAHQLTLVGSSKKACGKTYSYRVTTTGDWRDVRKKLITVGFGRGNDLLDVTLHETTQTISIDPFNVDFVPPTGDAPCTIACRVKQTSSSSATWSPSEDTNNICPIGAECLKQPLNSTSSYLGIVRSAGAYRYCNLN